MDRIEAAKISADDLVAARAVEIAEWSNTTDSTNLLAAWAEGADGARLTLDAKAAIARIKKR